MLYDRLAQELYEEISRIPIIDTHSHIDPHHPTARGLNDILGYHYYTELAHSVAMAAPPADPEERVRDVLYHMTSFDNTSQYTWFLEIARAFFDFQGHRITLADCAWLTRAADRLMARPDWEEHVLRRSNIERVFLTNDFDDPLEGFDTRRYVPCLRTDDLVFGLGRDDVRARVARTTGIEPSDRPSLRRALAHLFERFTSRGAKACAVSLPPDFAPRPVDGADAPRALQPGDDPATDTARQHTVFWTLAQLCADFRLPFAVMIGVVRNAYPAGVHQGRDLLDRRTSLIQFAPLFNAFPQVTFCVSVLASGQNQELVSYSWLFPNVIASGHWWYSNVPAFIEPDLRARLQAVPKTKQIGYYSDMYKLEFGLPKFNMYRRVLAQVLADDFIRPRVYTEAQALELARLLLHDNPRRIFGV